jgi:hypothetical protein
MDAYPGNTGSHYTVKLAQPINLTGQTLNHDVRWEVAMHSIHYTHNFYNFTEPSELRVFVVMPPPESNNYKETNNNVLTTTVWKNNKDSVRNTRVGLDVLDPTLLTMHTDEAEARRIYGGTTGLSGHQLFGKLFLPAKHYTSLDDIRKDLVAAFERTFKPCYGLSLLSTVLPSEGTLHFDLSNGTPVAMYSTSDYLAKTLGLPTWRFPVTYSYADGTQRTEPMYRVGLIGSRTPRFGGVQALYVYTDIVEPQHVGDTMAPLLDYVDVRGTPGERICHVSNPPVYMPVDKTHIDTITIRICDEHGKDVKFPDDVENVVVRLLFRKVKYQQGLFA